MMLQVYMSDKEVYTRYENSRSKREYPRICAELNDCSIGEVYDAINRHKESIGETPLLKLEGWDAVLDSYQKGLTDRQLMKKHKLTSKQVRTFRLRNDFTANRRIHVLDKPDVKARMIRLLENGMTDVGLAEEYGVSVCTIGRWRKRNDIPTSHEFCYKRRKAMVESGMTIEEVAEAENVDEYSLTLWFKRVGLEDWLNGEVQAKEIKQN